MDTTIANRLHAPVDYSALDLTGALARGGVRAGDIVFVQVCLDTLGAMAGEAGDDPARAVVNALRDAVGPEGTILAPSYTFSFCRREVFDLALTPAIGGPWSTSVEVLEALRRRAGAARSQDPIHAVAGLGPRAAELLSDVPPTCFGPDSLPHRLVAVNARVCTIGVGVHEATLGHHVEEMVGVPFRFKKLFTGRIRDNGIERKAGWVYSVRIPSDRTVPDARTQRRACDAGVCEVVRVGAGELTVINAQPYYEWLAAELTRDRWATARGPAADPLALEEARVPVRRYDITLPPRPSMRETVDALWKVPRDIVSDGYDQALAALASRFPMTVHSYPTGTECWTWIVPEKWTCDEAWLETMDGRRLFSYAAHPLHVVSYSLPFDDVVSREVLFEHLHSRPELPDAIPFEFKYYERDWGLCCTDRLKQTLTDDRYRVVIRTRFSYGSLKVGEVVVPGRTDETFVLCAHLCHPAMANDDLAGLAVGLEVMTRLQDRRDRRYGYRLLIVPETIGSAAFLSHNEALIPKMGGGVFLEMLGLAQPHALQLSFQEGGYIDQCARLALEAHDPAGWTGACRTVVGNDERQFNAQGVRVPMVSLSRVLPRNPDCLYYREYHTSHDTADLVSDRSLDESCTLVMALIDILETDRIVESRCRGEVFCSRFGFQIDWSGDRLGTERLFEALDMIDGSETISSIARRAGLPFAATRQLIHELERHGLVSLREPSLKGHAGTRF